MKKLFLIALFTGSSLAFAHCGNCGIGETRKCEGNAQCSSNARHDSDHAHTENTDSNTSQEESQKETAKSDE